MGNYDPGEERGGLRRERADATAFSLKAYHVMVVDEAWSDLFSF